MRSAMNTRRQMVKFNLLQTDKNVTDSADVVPYVCLCGLISRCCSLDKHSGCHANEAASHENYRLQHFDDHLRCY